MTRALSRNEAVVGQVDRLAASLADAEELLDLAEAEEDDATAAEVAADLRAAETELSELEREIWGKFWEYANDPVKAEKVGVRAAHGEAPYIKLMPGKRYKVTLRASGGLSLIPEDLPPDVKIPSWAETL